MFMWVIFVFRCDSFMKQWVVLCMLLVMLCMLEICEFIWKCSRFRQLVYLVLCSDFYRFSSWCGDRLNLVLLLLLFCYLFVFSEVSCMCMFRFGLMFSVLDFFSISFSLDGFLIMMKVCRFSLCLISVSWMYLWFLQLLQMISLFGCDSVSMVISFGLLFVFRLKFLLWWLVRVFVMLWCWLILIGYMVV